MKTNQSRRVIALGLAALLAGSSSLPAFAAEAGTDESPESGYSQEMARLQDKNMEYDELEALIKNYYGPIKSAYDMAAGMTEDQGTISVNERTMADDLLSQADTLRDLAKEQTGVDKVVSMATAQALRANANKLRSAASTMDRSLAKKSSTERQLDRQTNSLVMTVQSLMNQYEQLRSQRTIVAKAVELARAARSMQDTMQAQGMAVDADVLSAAASLASAQAQLNTLDAGIAQLHKLLCSFTGWSDDADPVIGPVPSADVAAIAAIDVSADKEKAVGNNYELITLRGTTGGGMTDMQTRTTKSTTQKENKLRNVEYSENTVRSNIQTLYDTILEKKAAYDSAATAYESAKLSWNAAQIQKANGSVSQLQFLQLEMAWLQAQSGFKCADLSLQQAMQDYNWAVKGVSVNVE